MMAVIREPLLHFLLLGAGLFLCYDYLIGDQTEESSQTIVIDRDTLLNFVQYRSRAFDAEHFNRFIDALPEKELQRLIDDYVREEALYREAKALQLDRNDYLARLRLIQQLEFITRGFAEAEVKLTEKEIEDHYDRHKDEFYVSPQVTFTHVFLSRERHDTEKAEALARATLDRLNRERVPFDQAAAYGDRFLYHLNYVAREPDEVASHFGTDMQQAVFALEPDEQRWRGPFESTHGFHLVLLTRNEAGYTPPLEEVRSRVEQQAHRAALDARFETSLQSIVQTYRVIVKREDFAAWKGGMLSSAGPHVSR